jgi:predicted patatin/cPLA2 family phospholipase
MRRYKTWPLMLLPPLAIVVEGGGLRGAFCAGVLATLKANLPPGPAQMFATSAGAPCAAYFATDQMLEAVRVWQHHTGGNELVSAAHWLRQRPLMDIDKLVSHFRAPGGLDPVRLAESNIRVHVSLTSAQTGEAHHVQLTRENVFEVLTATMALPIAYGRTVDVDGLPYVDGGISDSIPIESALNSGAREILVVLTQPREYRKRRSWLADALVRAQYPKHPLLHRAYASRPERYNQVVERVAQLEQEGRISVIRPDTALPASRMTRDKRLICQTLELGHAAAQQWLEAHKTRPQPPAEGSGEESTRGKILYGSAALRPSPERATLPRSTR